MKRILLSLPVLLLVVAVCTGAHDKVEGPGACKQCGMDRTVYAHSRMLIVYEGGS